MTRPAIAKPDAIKPKPPKKPSKITAALGRLVEAIGTAIGEAKFGQ
jgi:hypothetical protein